LIKYSDDQESKLVEVITTKTPDEVGCPNKKNWTVNIIKHWILGNFGVEYSYTSMVKVPEQVIKRLCLRM
jgi:putative transposase